MVSNILNESIVKNNRYYTAKNYKNNVSMQNESSESSNQQHKYYSVDHKKGVIKNNYSGGRDSSKYSSSRATSQNREYTKYTTKNEPRIEIRTSKEDFEEAGGTKKMLDLMIQKMMNKNKAQGKNPHKLQIKGLF